MKGLQLFLAGFLLVTLSSLVTWNLAQTPEPDDPVFVIGAVTILDRERLADYQAIAQPIAHSAGAYLPQAMGAPQLLEGELPSPGQFFVERFESQEALDAFLVAIDQSGVLTLRDEVAKVHFMLALPAYAGHVE